MSQTSRAQTAGENGYNGWRVRQHDGGRLEWTTPTGETITTDPDGAAVLWPNHDIEPLPTPEPRPREPFDHPIELYGYTIADDATIAAIEANTPRHSHIEELLEYLLDAQPRDNNARHETTATPDDSDSPPF